MPPTAIAPSTPVQTEQPINAKGVSPDALSNRQLAAAMREGTKDAHKAAENSVFTKRFLKGDITRDEYGQYILSYYFVYKSMESLLEKHKDDPVIKSIYFPVELNRENTLLKDIQYFYGPEAAAELTKPSNITPRIAEYVQAMEDACKINPALLTAHSYSRYLGDLSGGQILAKRLKKYILGVTEADGSWDTMDGVEFYHFTNIGNQVEFKNFYRECLNSAPVDEKTKDLIVKEAVKAFDLNINLVDEIQEMSEQNRLHATRLGAKTTKSAGVSNLPNSFVPLVTGGVAIAAVAAALYYRSTLLK